MAWTNPKDWAAAETVTAANMNTNLRDNLEHIAGTAGFTATPSATKGIEPLSGYFLGANAVNMHIEAGTDTTAGGPPGTVTVTFANAFAAAPIVLVSGAEATVISISATQAELGTVGTTKTVYWIALGSDV